MIALLKRNPALTRDKADALLLVFGALMVLLPHFGHLPCKIKLSHHIPG